MNKTRIPWAEYTWNPIEGCSPVSEGCQNCYAAALARRFDRPWGRIVFRPGKLEEPFSLRKPSRIFVCSTSDLFHADNPDGNIEKVMEIMAADSRHTYIILTKRPERALGFFSTERKWFMGAGGLRGSSEHWREFYATWPLPNIWLGVTAENQKRADERIPILLKIPASVHFVSIEPMLEAINIEQYLLSEKDKMAFESQFIFPMRKLSDSKINWVIAGPENGPHKRPFDPNWIVGGWDCHTAGIAAQCFQWKVPFFDKREGLSREYPR